MKTTLSSSNTISSLPFCSLSLQLILWYIYGNTAPWLPDTVNKNG